MDEDGNDAQIELIERFFADVINVRESRAIDNLVDPSVTIHQASGPVVATGIAGLREVIADLRDAHPGSTFIVYRSKVVDEFVVIRWTTAVGGRPRPTRAGRGQSGDATFRTSRGLITEIWGLVAGTEGPSYDDEDDDDGGPVGGRPSGPPWVPPVPQPKKRG